MDNEPVVQPQDQFAEKLAELSGGKFKSYEDVSTALGKYETVLPEYEALKAKANVDPFANELVKKTNDLFASGSDKAFVRKFVDLHFRDLNEMNPLEVLETEMRLGKLNLSDEEIRFSIENEYPEVDRDIYEDDESGYKKAVKARELKISIASKKAMENLKSMMADTGDGKLTEQRAKEESRRATLTTQWASVVNSVAAASSQLDFSFESDKIEGKYDFSYKPPSSAENQRIVDLVAQQAVQAGLELNEANIPKIKQMYDTLMWSIHREDFLRQMALDMYASVKEQLVKGISSSPNLKIPVPAADKKTTASKYPKGKRGDLFG